MSNDSTKCQNSKTFVAVVALVGCGLGGVLLYIHHERQEGSALNQLRKLDYEAQRSGWVKGSDGNWSLLGNFGTNAAGSQQPIAGTNKVTSDEK